MDKLAEFCVRDTVIRTEIVDNNTVCVIFGHENFLRNESVSYNGIPIDLEIMGLEIVGIQDETGTPAYHIPEGIFITFNGSDKLGEIDTLDTRVIAPSILKHFDIDPPFYMMQPIKII
jgi:hypothetical protein